MKDKCHECGIPAKTPGLWIDYEDKIICHKCSIDMKLLITSSSTFKERLEFLEENMEFNAVKNRIYPKDEGTKCQ